MAEGWHGSYDTGSQSDDSYRFERLHIEPIYDSFFCPLTKQVMRDPVTLENGQTFEREAIEKWFRECRETGRSLQCPVTLKDLKSTDLKPSIALRNTIEEWSARNEAAQLDMARKSLNLSSPEGDILLALEFVRSACLAGRRSSGGVLLLLWRSKWTPGLQWGLIGAAMVEIENTGRRRRPKIGFHLGRFFFFLNLEKRINSGSPLTLRVTRTHDLTDAGAAPYH